MVTALLDLKNQLPTRTYEFNLEIVLWLTL